MDTYDVIVIGAGSTGENVADRAVRGGLTAILIEAELVGGDCSYWACMPSKALLRGAEALAAARAVDGAKQAVTGEVDVKATLGRRDSFTSNWNDESQVSWAEGKNITVLRGVGRITGPKAVSVTTRDGHVRELTATQAVVVCTGSAAAIPPVPGLADAAPWTAREVTSAHAAPARLAIIGGGVVGCEMATAWSALGSEVTVLELAPRLLAGNEPFAGELVADSLRSAGCDVRVGVTITAVRREPSGAVVIVVDSGDVVADEVLVSAGRKANTEDLGIDTVGLEPGAWLDVDDTMLVTGVSGGWLYAAGDVNHRQLLTHMGKYQARACGNTIAARAAGKTISGAAWSPYAATADHHATPGVVFTEPQVASVGRTEAQARAAGLDVRTVEYNLGHVAGSALYADGYTGQAKLVIDESRKVIVGATFVGPGIAELLHSATIAVVGEVPLDRLWHAVPSYPTISEIWLRLLETYGL